MAIEIYIGTEQADCEADVPIVFSGGDIRDITEGRVGSSFEIVLPLSARNKKLLHYSNELSVFTEVSETGLVIKDGIVILKGKVVMTHVVHEVSATILIQGTGWVDSFKDKKLRTLDVSAHNHTFNQSNIENSWTGSANFYRYPMIYMARLFSQEDSSSGRWLPSDFLPMFRLVDILTEIFKPFTLSGGWLTDAAEDYVLAVESKADKEFLDGKGLEANVNSTSDNNQSDTIAAYDTDDVFYPETKVSLQSVVTDEKTAFFTSSNSYVVPEDGTYNFKLVVQTNWSATQKTQLVINTQAVIIKMYRTRDSVLTDLDYHAEYSYGSDILTLGTFTFENKFHHFELGDVIHFTVQLEQNLTNNLGSTQTVTAFLTTNTSLTLVWDDRCLYTGIGKTIVIADLLPDVTMLQFVQAVKEAYNLRFMPDMLRQVVHIDNMDDTYSQNVRTLENVDFESLETESISANYKSVLELKLKRDDADNAVVEYVKKHGEPYLKTINMSSVYCQKGIETYENSLFAFTVNGSCPYMNPALTDLIRIFGSNAYMEYQYVPEYRSTGFVPRILRWSGLTSGTTWYLDGTQKTQYPKAVTIDMTSLFTTNFQKTFHLIDRGKLIRAEMKASARMMQEFVTVVNDIDEEGFRAMYELEYGLQKLYAYLNKIEFNGDRAIMELIIKH